MKLICIPNEKDKDNAKDKYWRADRLTMQTRRIVVEGRDDVDAVKACDTLIVATHGINNE